MGFFFFFLMNKNLWTFFSLHNNLTNTLGHVDVMHYPLPIRAHPKCFIPYMLKTVDCTGHYNSSISTSQHFFRLVLCWITHLYCIRFSFHWSFNFVLYTSFFSMELYVCALLLCLLIPPQCVSVHAGDAFFLCLSLICPWTLASLASGLQLFPQLPLWTHNYWSRPMLMIGVAS